MQYIMYIAMQPVQAAWLTHLAVQIPFELSDCAFRYPPAHQLAVLMTIRTSSYSIRIFFKNLFQEPISVTKQNHQSFKIRR